MTLTDLVIQPWVWSMLFIGAGLALMVWGLLLLRQRRSLTPPVWQRVVADTEYYRRVLSRIFPARGYQVTGYRTYKAPEDEQPREVVFALRKQDVLYAALCVRWIVPVTSDVIGRFEQALAASKAQRGLIVTTSVFTDAARERARGLPVALYDCEDIGAWITQVWGQ